jgi:hypothetical protein
MPSTAAFRAAISVACSQIETTGPLPSGCSLDGVVGSDELDTASFLSGTQLILDSAQFCHATR